MRAVCNRWCTFHDTEVESPRMNLGYSTDALFSADVVWSDEAQDSFQPDEKSGRGLRPSGPRGLLHTLPALWPSAPVLSESTEARDAVAGSSEVVAAAPCSR